MIKKIATNLVQKIQSNGYIAYFAGGCVRDSILGITAKDYDIVTNATPKDIQKIFPKAQNIGAHFGVMLVRSEHENFEIATFRTDGEYQDNRHPTKVCFSRPEEDAFRRDFTINGLFEDPISGKLYDYVAGKNDLDQKIIRAIDNPDKRFKEDSLRLLRAIRFATVLNFKIEPNTWNAICENAHLLANISVERINQEFNKILLHKNRAHGLDLLVNSGLMEFIIPEVLALKGCEQPPQFHPEGDVYVHTHMMLGLLKKSPSLELCVATLLHDIGKPNTYSFDQAAQRIRFNGHDKVGANMARNILNRLKYPQNFTTKVVAMVENHMNFMNVSNMKKSTLRKFLARPTFQDDMELHRVDCLGSNGNLENYHFMQQKELEFANEPIIPKPLLTGRDLIAINFVPGKKFSQILKDVQEKQLEGELNSTKEALEFVKEWYL